MYDVVARTAEQVFIPLTVGGGVRSDGGRRPAAARRGRQGLAQHRRGGPSGAALRGGPALRVPVRRAVRGRPPRAGATQRLRGDRTAAGPGPGSTRWSGPSEPSSSARVKILLNSMDADGTTIGFDLELIRAVRAAVTVPVIAAAARARWPTSRPRWTPERTRSWRPACSTSARCASARSRTRCAAPATPSGNRRLQAVPVRDLLRRAKGSQVTPSPIPERSPLREAMAQASIQTASTLLRENESSQIPISTQQFGERAFALVNTGAR